MPCGLVGHSLFVHKIVLAIPCAYGKPCILRFMIFSQGLLRKIVVRALIALLLVAGLYMLLFWSNGKDQPTPSGTIFVTSSNIASSPFLETYAIHLDEKQIKHVGADETSVGTMYSFSGDGTVAAFIGITQDRIERALADKTLSGKIMQVYRAQVDTSGSAPLASATEALTDGLDLGKTTPAISNDGRFVLYVTSSSTADTTGLGSVIHVVTTSSTSTSDTVIETGIHPRWFSDDSFYYIGADGVRLYNILSHSSTLVLPVRGQSNLKLAVSPDRQTLAFSDPDARKVFVYSISPNGSLLTPRKTIDILGFWVVFSPDNHFMAVQTAEEKALNILERPSLVLFRTSTFTKIGQDISLSPMLNDRLFVTAWR